MIGLAVALGLLGCLCCCVAVYIGVARRHTWILERTYPTVDPNNVLPEVDYAPPQPREALTGGWSMMSEARFPAPERELTVEEHERVQHFFRDKFNSMNGWETSTATFRSY